LNYDSFESSEQANSEDDCDVNLAEFVKGKPYECPALAKPQNRLPEKGDRPRDKGNGKIKGRKNQSNPGTALYLYYANSAIK
jgi:hypothetical protein